MKKVNFVLVTVLFITLVNGIEIVNDDTDSIIVEASETSSPNDANEVVVPLNANKPTLAVDPERDSFLDWLAGLIKPNPSPDPVFPIGDPPENCPPCKCGVPNKTIRIVGGMEAKVLNYPWLAILMYGGRFYCGAALISDRYVLTAAHCLKGFNYKQISVKFLEHDMKASTTPTITRKILGYKIHKLYNTVNYNCDIGLVKLDSPVEFKDPLNPICLPEKSKAFIGLDSIVAGWGATSEGGGLATKLQEVTVPVWSNKDCKNSGYGQNRITDNMLCAGFKEGGKDACQGDSGGPLMIKVNDAEQMSVIGVVSWGQGCAKPNYPGVYSRVNRFHTWIRNNTIDSCSCEQPY